jgi:PIN domain nuclease of toxin-antitoxin system
MNLLLDTHTLIWFLEDNPQLSKLSAAVIKEPKNLCFVSIASLWKIAIKVSLGKLNVDVKPSDLQPYLNKLHIQLLDISYHHLSILETLPLHHRDPFDRIIISQSIANNLAVVTKDPLFKNYPVNIIW